MWSLYLQTLHVDIVLRIKALKTLGWLFSVTGIRLLVIGERYNSAMLLEELICLLSIML